MNEESLLKLQSWVDGELSEAEARRVAEWVATDRTAATLAAEIRMTRQVLTENEPEAKLADSREFYWSKIQRSIERADALETTAERLPWFVALRRLLVPVTGFAVIALLALVSLGVFHRHDAGNELGQLVEVENLSDGVDSMSYKSQSENMFVVYVFNKDSAGSGEEEGLDLEMEDDSVIQ